MSEKYTHNFLKNVTVRIDFSQNFYEISSDVPNALKEKLKENFPFVQRKSALAEQMHVVSETEVQRRHIRENHWFFQAKDGSKTLCLAPNFLWIDYKRYDCFDDLRATFSHVLEGLCESFPGLSANRFGLRYFNSIEMTDPHVTEWEDFLDKNLLSIFALADDKTKISRAFHNLEMNYGNLNLTFLYGMHNQDYPAPIRQKTFVLDFDAYSTNPQNKDELKANLVAMHDRIKALFEKSITDKLRLLMK